MAFKLTKFCTNFMFVFWPTMASVTEYPKYLGMDMNHPQRPRPPPDTVTTKCIKLFFGAIFDSINFGIVIAIIYWFFKSFISIFCYNFLYYTGIIFCSVLVYLIMYGLTVFFGSKTGIFPSSPEFSRRRTWSWSVKLKPISPQVPTTTVSRNGAAAAAIIEEGEIFYGELRKNLRMRKEVAIECEYQERLKEFHLNHGKSRRVMTRISLPIKQHKSPQPESSMIQTTEGAFQRHENVPADFPIAQSRNPDCNANLTNFVQQRDRSAHTCPNSEACECKLKESLVPQEKTMIRSEIQNPAPAKKHVNFEELEKGEEKSNHNPKENLIQKKASQYILRKDNRGNGEVEKISQVKTKEPEKPAMEQIARSSKTDNHVKNRKVLTPILKQRSSYQQKHRERKGTPSSPKTMESTPTHPKLYSLKTNKNVKFERQKPKTE